MIAKRITKKRFKPGQPTAYTPEHPDLAYKLCLLMATDVEIADCFGVTVETLFEWRRVHPEFSEACVRGKIQADAEIGHALKHRATGYSHQAVKIFLPAGAEEPVYAPYTQHYPPDTNAISFWLRNRHPDKWRDRQEVEHRTPLDTQREKLLAMTREERRSWMLEIEERSRLTIEHEPSGKP